MNPVSTRFIVWCERFTSTTRSFSIILSWVTGTVTAVSSAVFTFLVAVPLEAVAESVVDVDFSFADSAVVVFWLWFGTGGMPVGSSWMSFPLACSSCRMSVSVSGIPSWDGTSVSGWLYSFSPLPASSSISMVTSSSSSIGSNMAKGALTASASESSGANATVTSSPSSMRRNVPIPLMWSVPSVERVRSMRVENSDRNFSANAVSQWLIPASRIIISGNGNVIIVNPPSAFSSTCCRPRTSLPPMAEEASVSPL